jgi:Pyruvate/2-oxoacid:ferredoxin oxidoreductase delta subunit
MEIIEAKCTGCEECLVYCPVGAIVMVGDKAVIYQSLCCECGACNRKGVFKCPASAIVQRSMKPHQQIAANFSDPSIYHKKTGVPGRGAEEVKTNDVRGMVKKGEVGIAIEIGRPCLGARMGIIESFVKALERVGVDYECNNPLYDMLMDASTGVIMKEGLRNQHLISAIIQIKVSMKNLGLTLKEILRVSHSLDTAFSLSLITRLEGAKIPEGITEELSRLGLTHRSNAKINLGLGRPLKED